MGGQELPSGVITISSHCCLHGNSLIENEAVKVVTIALINNLYSGCWFMRTWTHFQQMVSSLYRQSLVPPSGDH